VNIDPVLAQFIITAIVAVPVYFKMRSEGRKATAEADSSSVKDALELKREYKSDMAALEVKHEALIIKVDRFQADLQTERAARAADKVVYEAEIAKLRLEVNAEREARKRERAEFQAQLDERDAVIVNLQGQLDRLQSNQSSAHGFKT
jgi:hypothetical protein